MPQKRSGRESRGLRLFFLAAFAALLSVLLSGCGENDGEDGPTGELELDAVNGGDFTADEENADNGKGNATRGGSDNGEGTGFGEDEKRAQFLIQATFGPTRESLAELKRSSSYKNWIKDQMALPVESHRAYWRQRVNPRVSGPERVGSPRSRCHEGSRWTNFALQARDVGKPIEVLSRQLLVDGDLRTIIDNDFVNNGLPKPECTDVPSTQVYARCEEVPDCYQCEARLMPNFCTKRCWDLGCPRPGHDCSDGGWPKLSSFGFKGFLCEVRQELVGGVVAVSLNEDCTEKIYALNPAVYLTDLSLAHDIDTERRLSMDGTKENASSWFTVSPSGSRRSLRRQPSGRMLEAGEPAVTEDDAGKFLLVKDGGLYVVGSLRTRIDPSYEGNGLSAPGCDDLPAPGVYASCPSVPDCYQCNNRVPEESCRQRCWDLGCPRPTSDCSRGWVGMAFRGFICEVLSDDNMMSISTSASCRASDGEVRWMRIPRVFWPDGAGQAPPPISALKASDAGRPISVRKLQIHVASQLRSAVDTDFAANGFAPGCSDHGKQGAYAHCEDVPSESSCYQCNNRLTPNSCTKRCAHDGCPREGRDCSDGGWPALSGRAGGFDGFVCSVESEAVGGVVILSADKDCTDTIVMLNPAVFQAEVAEETFAPTENRGETTEALQLSATITGPCSLKFAKFIRHGGRFYLADDRFELVHNTLEEPASELGEGGICVNAPKTGFNVESCSTAPSCVPVDVSMEGQELVLDRNTRELFYEVGGRFVYTIFGLRPDKSPCQKSPARSRWIQCAESDCASRRTTSDGYGSPEEIALFGSLVLLEGRLGEKDGPVRDIEVNCEVGEIGMVVRVNGEFFEHSHQDELSVYDFTDWLDAHPGGPEHIKKAAVGGTFRLKFPATHDLERWNAGSSQKELTRLGVENGTVRWEDLPTNLRSSGIKDVMPGSGKWVPSCGSPGEVANDPKEGHQFSFQTVYERRTRFELDTFLDDYDTWSYRIPHASDHRGAVWLAKALGAKDQLRQRVGWALAQTFVVSHGNKDSNRRTEMWLNYYDILLRHAFGNFKDLLREITYSPMMAEYLTYMRNMAYDRSLRYPDENYAREIMQLFTIGLWKLNKDGTQQKDASGNPIATYDNENIMDFARALTGFDEQSRRGNMEEGQLWTNPIDPLWIRAGWHDIYPKRDLDGGYLGDGYPLCSERPDHVYLHAGATFEFVGFAPSEGATVLELPSGSALADALCDRQKDGKCRPSVVRRLKASVDCKGAECSSASVELVKVQSGYYRFVSPPCVNFFVTPETGSLAIDRFGKVSSLSHQNPGANKFWVAWKSSFPKVGTCASGCTKEADSCLCTASVVLSPAFTSRPSLSDARAKLRIGAFTPKDLTSCKVCDGEVKVYTASGKYDTEAVFEVDGKFYKNAESRVEIGQFIFRNPPSFQSTEAGAAEEVESLLEHLSRHPNTPVFFAHRLIQRLVSSNPSPQYVAAVANAFRTGSVQDASPVKFSGAYGDIGAAVAATLLHAEAREASSGSSSAGALREPLLKFAHFLRSMEYRARDGQELRAPKLIEAIGEWPFESPSVFNFYAPSFQPSRFAALEGSPVGPEFQIFTQPSAIAFINGMLGMIESGELTTCKARGWGYQTRNCSAGAAYFALTEDSSDKAAVDELNLLLTGGRLGRASLDRAKAAFDAAPKGRKLQAAQRAILPTPEFNTLGLPAPAGERPSEADEASSLDAEAAPDSYRAMVVLFLEGGADTFNMLVPMNCDLWDEYQEVRSDAALRENQLNKISAQGQACADFGIHSELGFMKELYDAGELAFVANVGALAEPTKPVDLQYGNVTTCKGLYSHLDQQVAASTLKCQVQGTTPRGVGGRMADRMNARKLRTTSFSLAGASTWSQGFETETTIVHHREGVPRLEKYDGIQGTIKEITRTSHRNIYCEEYNIRLAEALKSSEWLGTILDGAKLGSTYTAGGGSVGDELKQVARLIATRGERKSSRDIFFVEHAGYDTHGDSNALHGLFRELNDAVRPFVAEMKAQGIWDHVVVATQSDFGRTLTSNGHGTDHGWAGNYAVFGGKVSGGQILNDYPASLRPGSDQDAGRGRLVPRWPWESMLMPLAFWMGVRFVDINTVLPNLANFKRSEHIIDVNAMFKGGLGDGGSLSGVSETGGRGEGGGSGEEGGGGVEPSETMVPAELDQYLRDLETGRDKAKDAQFLLQATFGPTRKSLEDIGTKSYKQWILDEMRKPVESHRAYWRERVAPRVEQAEYSGVPLGRCRKGSRWTNFALQARDINQKILVRDQKIMLGDGRRVVTDLDAANIGNDLPAPGCNNVPKVGRFDKCSDVPDCYQCDVRMMGYCNQRCWDIGCPRPGMDCSVGWPALSRSAYSGYVCEVQEFVGGLVKLSSAKDCRGSVKSFLNPAIMYRGVPYSSSRAFEPAQPDVVLLAEDEPAGCPLDKSEFVRYANKVYRFDQRMELVGNTLEAPGPLPGGEGGTCSSVAMSFVNEASCRLIAANCAPLESIISSASALIDKRGREIFFSRGPRYVYSVTGLRATEPPCGRRSRWKPCTHCEPSSIDKDLANQIVAAIAAALPISTAASGGPVFDVQANKVSCSGNEVPKGAVVRTASGALFQNVHGDDTDVFDLTEWVALHPGGPEAIKKWAIDDFVLEYPSWHEMERWSNARAEYVTRISNDGDTRPFEDLPSSLQTYAIASAFSPTATSATGTWFASCGSPGEVANIPKYGHRYRFQTVFVRQGREVADEYVNGIDYWSYRQPNSRDHRGMVWLMKALRGQDQLRQRMAWVLAQTFVVSHAGKDSQRRAESLLTYYDMLVRNAFGNFRDVLREVTYSPVMAEYLTYKKNQAYDRSGTYPDENYAREVMQLFSIGLWMLNEDGSYKLDSYGQRIPTYDNENIMDFSRVFTGFDEQIKRPNMEECQVWLNPIDPMMMRESWHDIYPKRDTLGGYIGDGVPLCSDLPPGSFLRAGARFEFAGYNAADVTSLVTLGSGSNLYAALCEAKADGQCRHALVRTLDADLKCSGAECSKSRVGVVKVQSGYYRFVPPRCANLFIAKGRKATKPGRGLFRRGSEMRCLHPDAVEAGIKCCNRGCDNRPTTWLTNNGKTCKTIEASWFKAYCNKHDNWILNEYCALRCHQLGMTFPGLPCPDGELKSQSVCPSGSRNKKYSFAEAEAACDDVGLQVCDRFVERNQCEASHVWLPDTCALAVAIHRSGKVSSLAHGNPEVNMFWVAWKNGFPTPETCRSPCSRSGETCRCPADVSEEVLFQRAPTRAEALAKLRIGAHRPASACSAGCGGEVRAFFGASGGFGANTVFEVDGRFFRNVESVVKVGVHKFRNPPFFGSSHAGAIADVETTLDHLFHHPNTAPFFAYRMLQRLATSNPSRAQVKAVVDAFKTGSAFGMQFSGKYGDLAASLAAALLHPETRGAVKSAETEAARGALREPVLKFVNFLRSMEYAHDDGDSEIRVAKLIDSIGQWPYESPSVFNFFSPSYRPPQWSGELVAPEFQIFTPPMAIQFLNGMLSTIKFGEVTRCGEDWGMNKWMAQCQQMSYHFGINETTKAPGGRDAVVRELDLLLTGGRLDSSLGAVRAAFDRAPAGARLAAAQRAVVLSPEFHTIGAPQPDGTKPPPKPKEEHEPINYKAMIMIMLAGGADTFNMLVPMDCDQWNHYQNIRKNIALSSGSLNKISTTGQACSKFGIHSRLPFMKELYEKKELAFISNIGPLPEPTNAVEYRTGNVTSCKGLFSHLDQQIAASTLQCQMPGTEPRGVGGRMADALSDRNLRTTSFSLAGTAPWSQGFVTDTTIVHRDRGMPRLDELEEVSGQIGSTTTTKFKNIYCEEYTNRLGQAIDSGERMGKILMDAKLNTSYPSGTSSIQRQLKQVANLISTRRERKAERDLFFVEHDGYDLHAGADMLNDLFQTLNAAVDPFIKEMKEQGIWGDVVMMTSSDFGRTLTSNGQGTDHAWAGNHVVFGGKVRGGKVLNPYPKLQEGSDQDIGRGRLVPKYPWENIVVPIAEWLGISANRMDTVFPNLRNFNRKEYILGRSTLFSA